MSATLKKLFNIRLGKKAQGFLESLHIIPKTYGIELPDRPYAFRAMTRHATTRDVEQVWEKACQRLEIDKDTTDIEELILIYTHLSHQPGILGITAKSLQIRARTYKLLNLGR